MSVIRGGDFTKQMFAYLGRRFATASYKALFPVNLDLGADGCAASIAAAVTTTATTLLLLLLFITFVECF